MSYDYPTAFSHWGDEEHAALMSVIASGRFTMGEQVAAFEEEFAAYHGMRHAVMVNSGSSANLIAVAALIHAQKIQRHDLTLVPALAWATTYAPLVQNDLDLVLGDCDGTWCMSGKPPRDVQFVVDVPILGQPGYSRQWAEYARVRNIPLMVDCCESLGSWSGPYGKRILSGTTGIVNTFSFFYSHQLSAIEGGMILTNDDGIADLSRMLRNHGLKRPPAEVEDFDDSYDFRIMGYNLRPLELHAAVGRVQLKKLDDFRRHREQNLNNFSIMTMGFPIEMQGKVHGTVPSPFGIAFTVESRQKRADLAIALRADGIDCRLPTGGSFRKHKYARQWSNQETPYADRIHDTGLFLGNAPWDMTPLLEKAVRTMKGVLCT